MSAGFDVLSDLDVWNIRIDNWKNKEIGNTFEKNLDQGLNY